MGDDDHRGRVVWPAALWRSDTWLKPNGHWVSVSSMQPECWGMRVSTNADRTSSERATHRDPRNVGVRRTIPTGVVDERLNGLMQLQRTIGNQAVLRLIGGGGSSPVIQRKPWKAGNEYVDFPEIQTSEKAPFKGFLFDGGTAAQQPTKNEAIVAIANIMATTQVPTSEQMHAPVTLRKLNISQSGVVPTDFNKGNQNNYNQKIDPFMLKVTGTYGGNEVHTLTIYYQFAQSSYGYAVKIVQDGETYEMHGERGKDALAIAQSDAVNKGGSPKLFKMYASGHDIDDGTPVHDLANVSATDTALGINESLTSEEFLARLKQRSARLDAVTKIAGEGSRWQCVRALAAQQHLKDGSRFWCRANPQAQEPDPPVHYLEFKVLWGLWKDVFKYKFNIADSEVADALRRSVNGTQQGQMSAMGVDDYQVDR
jgi:hypothetical protein